MGTATSGSHSPPSKKDRAGAADRGLAAVVMPNNWAMWPFETGNQHLTLSWLGDRKFFLTCHLFTKLVSLVRLSTLELQSYLTKSQAFH